MSVAVINDLAVRADALRTVPAERRARVLVTYSGLEGARAVAGELHFAGLPAHAEVLFAVPGNMIPLPAALRLRGAFPVSWYMRSEALPGIGLVGDEAIAKATEWGADLLIVGSQGSSNVEPPYFACISANVAANARCPVRIARPRASAPGAAPRLLVGVDGSADADEAVRELAGRKWPIGTAVRIVSVRERLGDVGDSARALQAMSRAADTLGFAGLEVSTETRYGAPAGELVAAAEGWNASCLVVGARGLGSTAYEGGQGSGLGSVCDWLARRAPISIEVVRS